MKWFLRGLAATVACGLLTVVGSGCNQDNEKSANITGVAPATPPDYTGDRGAPQKSLAEQGYPGASK